MSAANIDRVVVVGASLAGATAAFTLRECGFDGDIVLVGAESELPYERPALSKGYLAGGVPLENLLVRTGDDYAERRITLRLGDAAAALDVERRTVTVESGEAVPYTHGPSTPYQGRCGARSGGSCQHSSDGGTPSAAPGCSTTSQ